jgi:hypothetical protein
VGGQVILEAIEEKKPFLGRSEKNEGLLSIDRLYPFILQLGEEGIKNKKKES